ncbi:hypothetical protein KBY25_03215 [Ruegeria pomeroyi]|nr:hypothetical protein [Ruegeria pomeroyi]
MTAVILKPNEIEEWPLDQRIEVSVGKRGNNSSIRVPCDVFLFRQNTSKGARDGRLYGRGTIYTADRTVDGGWRFTLELSRYPSVDLYSHDLNTDVIDHDDTVEKELAEVRRVSWARFFTVSDDVVTRLSSENFGE